MPASTALATITTAAAKATNAVAFAPITDTNIGLIERQWYTNTAAPTALAIGNLFLEIASIITTPGQFEELQAYQTKTKKSKPELISDF